MHSSCLTIVIPTFEREETLCATLSRIVGLCPAASEVLVVDQTPIHAAATTATLASLEERDLIRRIVLGIPSIPNAMNVGLREARSPIVLFLDDDIIPDGNLVACHLAPYDELPRLWAVAGQVLQPEQQVTHGSRSDVGQTVRADLAFPFNSDTRAWVQNGMAGNLSVRRDAALSIGGFDENFKGVAYRFETEFCRRICRSGGKILFEPKACIRHLRCRTGGTRAYGDHRASASPSHGVGDYYFAFMEGLGRGGLAYALERPFREIMTMFHLKHPWFIPVKLVGEALAFWWAVALAIRGPKLLRGNDRSEP